MSTQAQIFISYKRHADPDEPLALQLRTALEGAGHRVFIDQALPIGVAWAQAINRQIEASDFLIVLLSAVSVQSEMVAAEVAYAHKHHQRTGKAKVLPIRVRYDEVLPYQLSHYLDSLQYAQWAGEADTEGLIRQLLDTIRQFADLQMVATPAVTSSDTAVLDTPKPYADPRFLELLYEPGGAMRVKDDFYLARNGDDLLRRELTKPHGTTTTIRAPRQCGKSSLLMRGIAQARQQRRKVVYLDLQPVEPQVLTTLDDFLQHFATHLVTQLRLDPTEVAKAWRGGLGAPDKTTYLLEDYVLPSIDTQLVLALDEVDRLLGTPFHDTFFGLLRFWHNSRALNELWEKLDLVLVISTEPHLLIKDVTQSPFNVGQKIRLDDFTAEQVQELNRRYQQPLAEALLPDFMTFLGGHPFLTHKALYTLVTEDLRWSQLKVALGEGSYSFGDHLRRYLWHLRDQPELRDALKRILRHGDCQDETIFYRLLQAGLIKGSSRQACTLRCGLYADYLKDKL
ncbi:MAG: AAA-like domain-containing protein [Caldilineaceae bacterium]